MGGRNPYIAASPPVLPTRAYRITFVPVDVTIEVDPAQLGTSHDGLPGSILDIALAHGIDIDHACGGVCACSTCHVIVRTGGSAISEPSEQELDMLEQAPGLRPESRLSCQAVPDGTQDLVVEIPDWNRNMIREEH